jgi:valyl-tRNA synthetase
VVAPWPVCDPTWQDATIEAQFARFQEVLRAIRDIRARQNVPPRKEVAFRLRCDAETAALLKPMKDYFSSMANAQTTGMGPDVDAPAISANVTLLGLEVFVDLEDLIDLDAEEARVKKEIDKLRKQIEAKERKLANKAFLTRAPANVVQNERDSLKELEERDTANTAFLMTITGLKGQQPKTHE